MIQIATIMTKEVISLHENDLFEKANEIFVNHSFHNIPVISSDNFLVGIISKGDFNKILTPFSIFETEKSKIENRKLFKSLLCKDVMTSELITLKASDDIEDAVKILLPNNIHCIPIVDDSNQIAGIVTNNDLLKYFYHLSKAK